jgi:hypothetical protein
LSPMTASCSLFSYVFSDDFNTFLLFP